MGNDAVVADEGCDWPKMLEDAAAVEGCDWPNVKDGVLAGAVCVCPNPVKDAVLAGAGCVCPKPVKDDGSGVGVCPNPVKEDAVLTGAGCDWPKPANGFATGVLARLLSCDVWPKFANGFDWADCAPPKLKVAGGAAPPKLKAFPPALKALPPALKAFPPPLALFMPNCCVPLEPVGAAGAGVKGDAPREAPGRIFFAAAILARVSVVLVEAVSIFAQVTWRECVWVVYTYFLLAI